VLKKPYLDKIQHVKSFARKKIYFKKSVTNTARCEITGNYKYINFALVKKYKLQIFVLFCSFPPKSNVLVQVPTTNSNKKFAGPNGLIFLTVDRNNTIFWTFHTQSILDFSSASCSGSLTFFSLKIAHSVLLYYSCVS
jgi:hypothetical protein